MSWSLSQQANFTADALAAMADPDTPYVPEATVLERITFLSSVRTGVNAAAQPPAPGQVRAAVTARVTVNADTGVSKPVSRTLSLYGPGDVIGIDADQVIRCEPPAGAAVPFGGTLAHIEFDDPALPWAFSPPIAGVAAERLQPWIALVVVEERAGQLIEGTGGLPPQLFANAAELFPPGDAWGWAHAQVLGGVADGPRLADRLTDAYGDINLSRLLCPRRLQPNRRYLACVVPTFGIGRTTGCGTSPSAGLEPAWGGAGGAQVVLPVYYHWSFETLAFGDFETSLNKLKPVAAPAGVGRRMVDFSRPGGGMAPAVAAQGAVQRMECALYSPLAPTDTAPWTNTPWAGPRTQDLRNRVNRGLDQANVDLPRVSPRAYGQFQRGAGKLTGAGGDWFDQLNADPLRRIAAGLGTRVVQKDADLLVEAAWTQAGQAAEVNKDVVDPAQFGRFVAEAVVKKGEDRMTLESLVSITERVQSKMGWQDGRTLAGEIANSATPRAATTAAYRRMTSAVGRVGRAAARLSGVAAPFAGLTTGGVAGAGLADMRRGYARPDGVAGFSPATLQTLPVDRVAKATGFDPAGKLNGFTPAADRIGQVAAPGIDVQIDLGQITAAGRLAAVKRVLADADGVTPGMREALGGFLATAAPAIAPAQAAELTQQLETLHAAVPEPAAPATAPAPMPGGGGFVRPPIDLRRVITAPPVLRGGVLVGRDVRQPVDPGVFARTPSSAKRSALQRFTAFNAGRATTPIGRGTIGRGQLVSALRDTARGTLIELGGVPPRAAARVTREALLRETSPARVSTRYAAARITLADRYKGWFDDGLLRPIRVDGPRFDRPMFEALRDYDRDWLVPGLGQIKATDFVTMLVGNARFAEAFMVGLSDEMGRELLWRGYPVDRRATFFSHFWNALAEDLKPDINNWPAWTALGTHTVPAPAGAQPGDESADKVVLMIRGEVVRTFPDMIVIAQQGTGKDPNPFAVPPPATGPGSLLFRARLDAETLVVGFDLTVAQIKAPAGAPWWFLIAEHPGAPRFGLDRDDGRSDTGFPVKNDLNDLEWGELPMTGSGDLTFGPAPRKPAIWGANAATNARVLLQSPVRAAFDAKSFVSAIKGAA